jgi:hypothetical protein
VLAHSSYPFFAAFPGSEKSPDRDSEIPITIGPLEGDAVELDPPPLEHAAIKSPIASAAAVVLTLP